MVRTIDMTVEQRVFDVARRHGKNSKQVSDMIAMYGMLKEAGLEIHVDTKNIG